MSKNSRYIITGLSLLTVGSFILGIYALATPVTMIRHESSETLSATVKQGQKWSVGVRVNIPWSDSPNSRISFTDLTRSREIEIQAARLNGNDVEVHRDISYRAAVSKTRESWVAQSLYSLIAPADGILHVDARLVSGTGEVVLIRNRSTALLVSVVIFSMILTLPGFFIFGIGVLRIATRDAKLLLRRLLSE